MMQPILNADSKLILFFLAGRGANITRQAERYKSVPGADYKSTIALRYTIVCGADTLVYSYYCYGPFKTQLHVLNIYDEFGRLQYVKRSIADNYIDASVRDYMDCIVVRNAIEYAARSIMRQVPNTKLR